MCFGRNLLRPAGVQLQPATFKLKLYYAEDLPRSKLCYYYAVVNWVSVQSLTSKSTHTVPAILAELTPS